MKKSFDYWEENLKAYSTGKVCIVTDIKPVYDILLKEYENDEKLLKNEIKKYSEEFRAKVKEAVLRDKVKCRIRLQKENLAELRWVLMKAESNICEDAIYEQKDYVDWKNPAFKEQMQELIDWHKQCIKALNEAMISGGLEIAKPHLSEKEYNLARLMSMGRYGSGLSEYKS